MYMMIFRSYHFGEYGVYRLNGSDCKLAIEKPPIISTLRRHIFPGASIYPTPFHNVPALLFSTLAFLCLGLVYRLGLYAKRFVSRASPSVESLANGRTWDARASGGEEDELVLPEDVASPPPPPPSRRLRSLDTFRGFIFPSGI